MDEEEIFGMRALLVVSILEFQDKKYLSDLMNAIFPLSFPIWFLLPQEVTIIYRASNVGSSFSSTFFSLELSFSMS